MKLLIKLEERLLNYLQTRHDKRVYKEHKKLSDFINSRIVVDINKPVFKLKAIK